MSNRQIGESQLDYLWTHFGNFKVKSGSGDNTLLTESAIMDLICKAKVSGIVKLVYREHPHKKDTMQLIGQDIHGSTITLVEVPKEVHVAEFTTRTVTGRDKKQGCPLELGAEVLSLVLTNGKEFLVDLVKLVQSNVSGFETETIRTDYENGVIIANLKIDRSNNNEALVKLNVTKNGVYAQLRLAENKYGIELVKESDGLAARIPFNGDYLRFVSTTSDEYALLSEKDPTTVYFLTDLPYIYLNGVRYGANIKPGDNPIISLEYDEQKMTLTYKTLEGSSINIVLGPADETKPGMMSIETYVDIQNLKKAVGDIDNVAGYVDEHIENAVNEAGFKLEYGKEENGKKPLNLINKNGEIISTVLVDVENYLQFVECRIATEQDIQDSHGQVKAGEQILILTLVSGDRVFVSLNNLVDIYTGGETHSIKTSVDSGIITSDLKICSEDKLLTIAKDGLRAQVQLVREANKLLFYGREQNEECKIAEIKLADALYGFIFVEKVTPEIYQKFPPKFVDGKPWDDRTNDIKWEDSYIILYFNQDSEYTIDQYAYYSWINVIPILKTIRLSPDPNNTLEKDKHGYLFNAVKWIEV